MSIGPVIVAGGALILAGAKAAQSWRVGFIDQAAGTHPALRSLLGEWSRTGTHDIVIAPADTAWPYPGGVRTDEQLQQQAAGEGLSGASSLAKTAHGRGAGLDVWPKGFDPFKAFDARGQLAGAEFLMRVFGEWAERQTVRVGSEYFGFTWGGRFGKPDLPHVELTGWARLPFPPPNYGGGFA